MTEQVRYRDVLLMSGTAAGMLLLMARLFAVDPLTPEQKLKAQVQQLTEQNLQLQASLAQCQLTSQQAEIRGARQILDSEFRVALKCTADEDLEGWPPTGCKKKAAATNAVKPPQ